MRVALIAGGTGGIGKHVALRLAALGYALVLVGRKSQGLYEMRSLLVQDQGMDPQKLLLLAADLSSPEAVAQVMQNLNQHFGRLDLLIHAAGTGLFKPLIQSTMQESLEILDSNLLSAIFSVQACLPLLSQAKGKIILISSGLALRPARNAAVYSAAKHAIQAFAQALRPELKGVKIATLLPAGAGVNTPFWDQADPKVSRQGMMHPDDVARAVLSLVEHMEGPGPWIDQLVLRIP